MARTMGMAFPIPKLGNGRPEPIGLDRLHQLNDVHVARSHGRNQGGNFVIARGMFGRQPRYILPVLISIRAPASVRKHLGSWSRYLRSTSYAQAIGRGSKQQAAVPRLSVVPHQLLARVVFLSPSTAEMLSLSLASTSPLSLTR